MSFRQKTFRFMIRGDEWKIVIFCSTLFKKKHGDCTAIMDTDERWIHFRTDRITKMVVTHELFHVFCSYLYHNSADLSNDQLEESIAEFMEKHLDEYYNLIPVIFNKIIKYKTEEVIDIIE